MAYVSSVTFSEIDELELLPEINAKIRDEGTSREDEGVHARLPIPLFRLRRN